MTPREVTPRRSIRSLNIYLLRNYCDLLFSKPRHQLGVGLILVTTTILLDIYTTSSLSLVSIPSMRSLLRASLALSTLATVLSHPQQGLPRRKTLAFGPAHPHAKFTTSPEAHISSFSFGDASDPIEVAKSFVDYLTQDLGESSLFKIRDDSYTDDRTGVSHVYVKQLIRGLEVADGDINLNIKDGRVISYGDSVRKYRLVCLASFRAFYSFIEGSFLRRMMCQYLNIKFTASPLLMK